MPQTNLAGCGKRETKHGNNSCIFWCDPKNWVCLRNLPPQNTRHQSWGPFEVGFPQKNTRHSKPNRPNLPCRFFFWRCSSGHMHSSMICEALDKEHWASHQMAYEAPDSGSGFKLRKGTHVPRPSWSSGCKNLDVGWFTWTSGIAVVHGKTSSYPHLCIEESKLQMASSKTKLLHYSI